MNHPIESDNRLEKRTVYLTWICESTDEKEAGDHGVQDLHLVWSQKTHTHTAAVEEKQTKKEKGEKSSIESVLLGQKSRLVLTTGEPTTGYNTKAERRSSSPPAGRETHTSLTRIALRVYATLHAEQVCEVSLTHALLRVTVYIYRARCTTIRLTRFRSSFFCFLLSTMGIFLFTPSWLIRCYKIFAKKPTTAGE